MSKKLLILDSGHNEYVAGKRSPDNSLLEWSFNNDMQKLIKSRAEAHGIEVYLTNPSPAKKDEIGLSTRCKLANNYWVNKNKPTALFVSLHANAFGTGWTSANGTEVFVCKNASSSSVNAGKLINNQIVKDLGTTDRTFGKGVKYNDYFVIKNTNMPGVLIEYGFYSNKQEVEILKNKKPELAESTIKGICAYFGIKYVPPTSNNTTTTSNSNEDVFKTGDYNKPVKVTANVLNVRSGRGTKYNVVSSLKKGDIIDVWTIKKGDDGKLWASFRYAPATTTSDGIGFCSCEYLAPYNK